jgi:hypothetical protein
VRFVWQRHELFHTAGLDLAAALGVPSVLFVPAPLMWQARQWGVRRPGWSHLLEQFGEVGSGIVPGLIGFGADVARTAVAPVRAAVDVARGELGGKNLWEIAQREVPAFTQVGTSIAHTGQDIIDPSRFAQASKEGTIVSKVLEDIGNAALVSGPVGKALGTAGTVAGEAGAIGGEVAGEAAAQAATRGTGLAGLAARAGAPELAQGLESAGRGIHYVGHLGEKTGVVRVPPPDRPYEG